MTIVANFTPDRIPWEHIGHTGVLEADTVTDMPEGRGKHLLNKYSPRGIIELVFGDNEEIRKEEAMATWKGFWERQIENFNQQNEGKRNKGIEYTRPTKEQKAHADVLRLKLIAPWVLERSDDAEVKELRSTVDDLKNLVASLVADKTAKPAPEPPTKEQKDWNAILARASGMNTETFGKMIADDGFIDGCPANIKEELRARYAKLKFTEPCPF